MGIFNFDWLQRRSRTRAPHAAPAASERATSAYAAIEINADEALCCEAAKALLQQKILASQAPVLPLPGCDASVCRCRYSRFADRRDDARRDADVGIGTRLMLGEDRRTPRRGRRTTD